MTLPTGFDAMPSARQLFVLANIERVDRGLIPIEALTAPLNALAQTGAANDDDPAFPQPFYGDGGGSNWAGAGTSALLPEFLWVYDDGLGSGNADCQKAGDMGCWGHRHNILATYDAPLLMGAAEVADKRFGGSAAEEFISRDNQDAALAPRWAKLRARFQVGLSRTSVHLSTGTSQVVPITAWASGEDMNVSAAVTAGTGAWSVFPDSCQLAAGSSCMLNVWWNPQAGSASNGTLSVTGPNGVRKVALKAPLQPGQRAHLSAGVAPTTLEGATSSTSVSGVLTDVATGHPLSGRVITVERHPIGTTSWTKGSTSKTSKSGRVRVTARPRHNTVFRLVAAAAGSYPVTTSSAVTVRVRPRLTLSTTTTHVTLGSVHAFTVASSPALTGQRVMLQERIDGRWRTVRSGRLNASGHHRFAVHFTAATVKRFRAVEPSSTRHLGVASRSIAITAG